MFLFYLVIGIDNWPVYQSMSLHTAPNYHEGGATYNLYGRIFFERCEKLQFKLTIWCDWPQRSFRFMTTIFLLGEVRILHVYYITLYIHVYIHYICIYATII